MESIKVGDDAFDGDLRRDVDIGLIGKEARAHLTSSTRLTLFNRRTYIPSISYFSLHFSLHLFTSHHIAT